MQSVPGPLENAEIEYAPQPFRRLETRSLMTGISFMVCKDTCNRGFAEAKDGWCDDGGSGSLTGKCELGTDCTDCGTREIPYPDCEYCTVLYMKGPGQQCGVVQLWDVTYYECKIPGSPPTPCTGSLTRSDMKGKVLYNMAERFQAVGMVVDPAALNRTNGTYEYMVAGNASLYTGPSREYRDPLCNQPYVVASPNPDPFLGLEGLDHADEIMVLRIAYPPLPPRPPSSPPLPPTAPPPPPPNPAPPDPPYAPCHDYLEESKCKAKRDRRQCTPFYPHILYNCQATCGSCPPPAPPQLPPPFTPPAAKSPPPLSTQTTTQITFSAVVAGSIATFDSTAFKANLASALAGVEPSDISLNVTAASVRVDSTIIMRDASIATSTFQTLSAFTPETLSKVLNVQVESFDKPIMTATSSGTGTGSLDEGGTEGALEVGGGDGGNVAGIVIGIVAGVLALGGIYYCVKKRGSKRGRSEMILSTMNLRDHQTHSDGRFSSIDGPAFDGVAMSQGCAYSQDAPSPARDFQSDLHVGSVSSSSQPAANPIFSANFDDADTPPDLLKVSDEDADMRL